MITSVNIAKTYLPDDYKQVLHFAVVKCQIEPEPLTCLLLFLGNQRAIYSESGQHSRVLGADDAASERPHGELQGT